MSGRTIYLLSALIGGAVLPVQVALNTLLRRYIGEPMQVTFIPYLCSTLALLIICLFARYPFPALTTLSQTSWWMWVGGCLGTLYVWSTIFATPQIGAALTLGLTIAGQMIAALLLDNYGAIGLSDTSHTFPLAVWSGLPSPVKDIKTSFVVLAFFPTTAFYSEDVSSPTFGL